MSPPPARRCRSRDPCRSRDLSASGDSRRPRLLAPAERGMVHYSPAFSRDARQLAYVSCKGQRSCAVYGIDLDANLAPTTPARQLTRQTYPRIGKVAWSPDGRSIIYDARGGADEQSPLARRVGRRLAAGATRSGRLRPPARDRQRWQSRRFHALALRHRHQSVRAGRTGAGPAHIDLPGYEPAVLARRPAYRVQLGADCRNAGDLGRCGRRP